MWSWFPRVTLRRLAFVGLLLTILRFGPSIIWPSFLRNSTASQVVGHARFCEHFLGRELVVDDRGRVCLWESTWNKTSGCCDVEKADDCAACSGATFLCCEQYEKCVACCQQRGVAFKWCLQSCRFSSKDVEGDGKSKLKREFFKKPTSFF